MRFLAISFVVAIAASGCMSDKGDGLDVTMDWQDRSHGRMTMRNMGGDAIDMRQAMAGMTMMGPNGTVPMLWGGLNGTLPGCTLGNDAQGCGMGMHSGMGMMHGDGNLLGPGDSWTYTMHAGTWNGTWGMMVTTQGMGMTHAAGHMAMMPGEYTMHMDGRTATATLG